MRRLPAYALALGIAASGVARPAHADAGAQRGRADMAIRAVEVDATKGRIRAASATYPRRRRSASRRASSCCERGTSTGRSRR